MSRKLFYMSSVAGFAALLASGSVSAATISAFLSNPIGGGEPTFASPGPRSSLTDITAGNYSGLQFAKFNTNLGTLTSISIQLYIDYSTVLSIVNSAISSSTGDANTRIVAKTNLFTNTVGPVTVTQTFAMPSFTYALGAGESTVVGSDSDGSGPISILRGSTNATDKTAYSAVGSNNVDLTGTGFSARMFTTLTDTQVSNTGGATAATQLTNLDVDGQITYTYNLIPPPPTGAPEPMTAAVLMAGLAGLAGIRRRR